VEEKSMLKRLLCLTLVASIMLVTSARLTFATEANAKEAAFTEKVKASIAKLGTGPSARVQLTLHDKTKLKGYISEANGENFVVVNEKTGVATEVAYPQVKQVKGNNLSTGAKVCIGLAVGFLVLVLIFRDHINAY